nr:integrase, catalytic region, zinc finger, CCHC-type, peptidase aspartic, catalytic [Tanacetum cinerariifolium]
MVNLSEDIQCAGSDTQPPMLDRTDFALWQQRIRLYCRGKENRVNILKSIDEGPFQMGTIREPLAEGTEEPPHLGPERPQVYSDLSPREKDRYNADIRATNILPQGLPKDIYTLINHYTNAKDIWDNVKMLLEGVVVQNFQGQQNRGQGTNPRGGGAAGYEGVQNRVGNPTLGQARWVKCYNCNGIGHIARNCTQLKLSENSDYYKDKMLLMQAQENEVALDEEQLLFLAVDDCDVFDSDVDEAPTAQTMFMANLPSADPVNDEAEPSYDSYILSEVQDHDHHQDTVCAHHEEHVMHDNVQLNYVVDSHANYTSDSNMILYDQYVKDNAVPVVHKDTLEIAEITRRKMNDKMKDPECVTHKTTVSRPIKALTVYPPKTPATLVPRVLPTKSQVKIYIFPLIQLFSEFNKTCKKRITPTGLTEGERGFEQTKVCYLKEVIPFFQTLKENFEGIQNALTKEMKDVFEELEAEVAQNVIDRKHDEIKRKKLLIANDNLIVECLSKEVFSVATNSELNVARFTEMHVAHTIVKTKLSSLRDKSHNDNHDELVNRFSNLEVNHLNLQLKYQNLKDGLGNNPPTPDKDTPDFDSVFVIGKMQASLQGKDNVIRQLKKQISHLQETRSDTDLTLKVRTIDSHITHLTKKVTVLQAQNDSFRAENDKTKQHYKELYDSIKITRKYVIDVEPIVLHLKNNKEAHLDYLRHLKESVETICDIVEEAKVVRPLDSSIVFACRYIKHSQELLEYAIGTCLQDSYQRDKKHAPAPLIRKNQVTFAKPSDTSNSCSKHMTGDRSRLMNFVKKFIGTVRFENDHFGAIMGYGDYVIGDSVISKVYYVEGLGHNLFSVR